MYLGGEIFENGGEVDRSTGSDAFGVFAGFEKASDSSNGELEAGFTASGN